METFQTQLSSVPGIPVPASASTARRRRNYLTQEDGLMSWLFTSDHKRIAILYLVSVSFFFLLGGLLAMVIRMHLLTPEGSLMASDTYNKVFTMHGVVMVFFVLIPAVPAILGNFVLPMMLGARDLAFPKINLLSWYCFVVAGLLLMYTVIAGATVMGMGFFATGIYLIWSLRYGAIATDNPWRAAGLEWQTSSPPVTRNFEEIPIVDHEAYNYDEIDARQAESVGAD